jgi:phospholipase D1/2
MRTRPGSHAGTTALASPRVLLAIGLACAAAIVGLWLWWPLGSPDMRWVIALAERARAQPLAPLVALVCFAIGGVVVFPVNLLIAATIVVFGPIAGGLYALAGSVLSAALVHEIGRLLPEVTVRRWFGERGERLRERIVDHGLLAIAVVRILPLAPYSVVGFVSGAARVRRRDYLLGTALGMLPGIALYALFVDRALAVLLNPHPLTWLLLAGALGLVALAVIAPRVSLRRHDGTR